MIDKKIEGILSIKVQEWGDGIEVYQRPNPEAVKKIKSLFKEYAMEIIGDDERLKKITPKNSMDRVIAQTRNSLRAEQREKLLTITEGKK